MKPLISVIIPTRNAGGYLEKCLGSVTGQTLQNFEAVIVDSESSDATVDIAKRYCNMDSRFQLIQCENCKPGIARNFGIEKANGQYISFADADDIMHDDMLDSLYEAAERERADIAVCDFDMVYDDYTVNKFASMEEFNASLSDNKLSDYYFKFSAAPKPNNYVWARMYQKKFLDKTNVLFRDVRYSEDHLFNLMLLCYNPKVTHVSKALYDYVQRDNSAMRQHVRAMNHGELFLEAFKQAKEYVEGKNKSYAEPILAIYAFTRIKSILFYAKQARQDKEKLRAAIDSFIAGDCVRQYLSLCIDKNYLERYCSIHGYSNELRERIRTIIHACVSNGVTGDILNIF